ncbi:MAG: trypsin-like peptidase domain-containing protein [Carboxydocellales bacterium]
MPETTQANRPAYRVILIAFIAGVLALAVPVMALNPGLLSKAAQAGNTKPAETGQLADYQVKSPASLLGPTTIRDIVTKTGPAVVKIETQVQVAQNRRINPYFNDPFFREFFGGQQIVPEQQSIQKGMGSGFIISKDGYILTNEHVIDGADKITVTVNGYSTPFTAQLVGADYDKDLAVLKIKTDKDLPTLPLGKSENILVGDWVIAIGNPYGLDHTVTVGVISAKGRPVNIEDRHYENLLQTDTSINPGNSGGPLLNLNGEVVGINTAVNAQAQGIGFAIPTSTVQGILQDLMKNGKVTRPWLGVYLQPITKELADYFGLKNTDGVIVSSVAPGGPAEKAGLQRGDIILEYNKKPVKSQEDLVELVQKTKVGDKIVLVVFRDGSSNFVEVTIEAKKNGQK